MSNISKDNGVFKVEEKETGLAYLVSQTTGLDPRTAQLLQQCRAVHGCEFSHQRLRESLIFPGGNGTRGPSGEGCSIELYSAGFRWLESRFCRGMSFLILLLLMSAGLCLPFPLVGAPFESMALLGILSPMQLSRQFQWGERSIIR